jgi:hypothetical protein
MVDRLKKPVLSTVLVIILTAAFALFPLPGGDDWEVFYHAGRRVFSGDPLYGEPVYDGFYYYNAPWLAVLIAPLTLLPSRVGWAILSVSALLLTVLVVRRWRSGLVQPMLALLSPPMFYILLHGQVDALALAGILLPQTYWGLVALCKPQVAFGLLFGTQEFPKIIRMAVVTSLVMLLSFLFFGLWPIEVFRQPGPVGRHNVWLGLWPFQTAVGIGLIFWAINRRDERFLVAASPFFWPYASTSSLLGPWIVMGTLLKDWQAAVVLAGWWAAVAYRYLI